MNIYDISLIESAIEKHAMDNDGEIPEELLKELVESQTKSVQQVEKLCHYIRHLEQGIDNCKAEEQRIKDMRQHAERRISSIKKYLTPYVLKKKKVDVGTFKLSSRRSQSVQLRDDFDVLEYISEEVVRKPDKIRIKEALKNGEDIPGAFLLNSDNLQLR